MNKNWYAIRSLFQWYFKNTDETVLFEERVVLFLAESFNDALDQAEAESADYCEEDPNANFYIQSLNKYSAYEITENELESGVELLSYRRELDMDTETYLKRFYPETLDES